MKFEHTDAWLKGRYKSQSALDHAELYAIAVETLPFGHLQIDASKLNWWNARDEFNTFVAEVSPEVWRRLSEILKCASKFAA